MLNAQCRSRRFVVSVISVQDGKNIIGKLENRGQANVMKTSKSIERRESFQKIVLKRGEEEELLLKRG